MDVNRKIILFGAGRFKEEALRFFGIQNVYCYVDNNKHGQKYCGKKIISFEELLKCYRNYRIVVSVGALSYREIVSQLDNAGIPYELFGDIYCDYLMHWGESNSRVSKWKNAFVGKKCFLVGNGPSLRTEDLEKIQEADIITMGCNFINKLFDKTSWRPDFFCCCEVTAVMTNLDFIRNSQLKSKFIIDLETTRYSEEVSETEDNDICLVRYVSNPQIISDDPSRVVTGAYSVMSVMLEIALYMGFSEIYLIGVDNTMPPTVFTSNFLEVQSHFYSEDADELQKRRETFPEYNLGRLNDDWFEYQNNLNRIYSNFKAYAENKGVRILNATRGGKLEVFERVDFDSIF